MTVPDPFVRHACYCALPKEQRRHIVDQLWRAITEMIYSNTVQLPNLCAVTRNWESTIMAFRSNAERDKIFTLVLDSGVSFSDGTDGVSWGTRNGLKYHGQPVSLIAKQRQKSKYKKQKLQELNGQVSSLPSNYKQRISYHFQHQLLLAKKSTGIQSCSP